MRSLSALIQPKQAAQIISYSTDTLYDIFTGSYIAAHSDYHKQDYILQTGLVNLFTGQQGMSETFKSFLSQSLIKNSTSIYDGCEAYIYDTENVLDRDKYNNITATGPYADDTMARTTIVNAADYDLDRFNKEILIPLHENKLKYRKDFEIEIPWIDVDTGKPRRILRPTFVLMDSLSEAKLAAVQAKIAKAESLLDEKTAGLEEARGKAYFIRSLPPMLPQSNIVFLATAHVGKDKDIGGGYGHKPKVLANMRMDEKTDNVSNQFYKQTATLLQTMTAKNIVNSTGKSKYPCAEVSSPTELVELKLKLIRCKSHASGEEQDWVVSRGRGILNDVSYYNYITGTLKTGFTGGNNKQLGLMPDLTLANHTVRDAARSDFRVHRALQFISEIGHIQKYWNHTGLPSIIDEPLNEICERIVDCKEFSMEDVLNTRGYWTWNKDDPRKYCSTLKLLNVVDGKCAY